MKCINKYRLKTLLFLIIFMIFQLMFIGCEKSILIDEEKAITAPSFELPIIANMEKINDEEKINLNELLEKHDVEAIMLHFCSYDDLSIGWTSYFTETYENYKTDGLISIMILVHYPIQNIADKDEILKNILNLINETHTTMPVLWDYNKEVAESYKISGVPTTFLIDKNGKIRFVRLGYDQKIKNELAKAIKELLKS